MRRWLMLMLLLNPVVAAGLDVDVEPLRSPAGPGSSVPSLYCDQDGNVYLSWVESDTTSSSLKFSSLDGKEWAPALMIAGGEDWFVNWADVPSVVSLGGGRLAAHWLQKSGPDTYAYDVKIAQSTDGGRSWSDPVKPHRDGTETEHGFLSMVPLRDGRLLAVWLDGRNYAQDRAGPMTLRAAEVDADGKLHGETVVDSSVCDCCPTSAVPTTDGIAVVYRGRTHEEIRDILSVRYAQGRWDQPRFVNLDQWNISGCPVNGPAIASGQGITAVAWFTAAGDAPRVLLAFSRDGGLHYEEALRVDDGNPVGRVDVVVLPDGSALVVWLEATQVGAEIRMRPVRSGVLNQSASTLVAQTSEQRASGFPRVVRSGETILFAWTELSESTRVRTAIATLNSPGRGE